MALEPTDTPQNVPPSAPPDGEDAGTGPAHAQRRTIYGVSSALAFVAVVGVVAGINWLAANKLDDLPNSIRRVLRIDLTQTREHSLSERTTKTLTALPNRGADYRVVLLLDESSMGRGASEDPDRDAEERRRVLNDLVDEYRRLAPSLQLEDIRRGVDIQQEDQIYRDLRDRYADEITPVTEAMEDGLSALDEAVESLQDIASAAEEAGSGGQLSNNAQRDLQAMKVELAQLVAQLIPYQDRLREASEQPLPDYRLLIEGTGGLIGQLDNLRRAVDQTRLRAARANRGSRIDALLRIERLSTELMQRMTADVAALRQAVGAVGTNQQSARGYDAAARQLASGDSIVVFGPAGVRVIPADRAFISAISDDAAPTFLGEELITGAIAALGRTQPPLVVFVKAGRGTDASSRTYEGVTRRLRALGMEVTTWEMLQRLPEPGNPYKPDPALAEIERDAEGKTEGSAENSEENPDRPVVYIFEPFVDIDAQGTAAMDVRQQQERYLNALAERLDRGDGVLIFATPGPRPPSGEPPLAQVLREYGVVPMSHRPILREVVAGEITRPDAEVTYTRWPTTHPISRGLDGLPGILLAATPIVLLETSQSETTRTPLIELTGDRLWTVERYGDLQNMAAQKFNPATAEETFVPAVAVERDHTRMVVVASMYWVEDVITTRGTDNRVGTADYVGQLFPGNSEMFLNSVLWLAGMDDQIAASPRVQDIRRIGAISEGAMSGIRWLLLLILPALIAVVGIVVNLNRRRG